MSVYNSMPIFFNLFLLTCVIIPQHKKEGKVSPLSLSMDATA